MDTVMKEGLEGEKALEIIFSVVTHGLSAKPRV